MCLTLKKEYKIEVATESIVCYKELTSYRRSNPQSFHTGYEYKRGKLNPQESINVLRSPRDNPFISPKQAYTVNRGYHSRIEDDEKSKNNSVMIIPKGTRYVRGWENDTIAYEDKENNYVSEQIIYMGPKKSLLTKLRVMWYFYKEKRANNGN